MTSLFSNEAIFIAHRAADASMPENTLESMIRMQEKGASWFEIDCYLMADGNIAVIHDEKLQRTTTGRGKITKMTAHDLHGVFVVGGDGGEKIPMLPDLMEHAYQNNLHLMIEIKGSNLDLAHKVDALIGRYDSDLFRVYAFEKKVIELLQKKKPKYQVHWNMNKLKRKDFEAAKEMGCNINLSGRYAGQSDIEQLKEAGMEVFIFTINDEMQAKQFLDYGVDGIITDTLIRGD